MRTEAEMISLIKDIAFKEENIRAAYIEGSRTNPNAPKDIFQDYDIVYIVTTTKPFREDKEWINNFGKILYMHYPEDNVFYPSDVENCYGWQIQFADGNRMDLHVCTKENALANLELYQILVDKDGIVPYPQETTDERYWVKEPREIEFKCTCSDFWWCLNNVAKGLWRNELPYAMDVINFVLRPHLKRLLEWKMGIENNFSVSAGKSCKYFKKYLQEETYRQFLATYSIAEIESIWNSVFEMCDLFQSTAVELSKKQKFVYDFEQAENSLSFLHHVRKLPANAKEIYP
ncbi:aminoglycoside 6-adenylyltransferase [bacterium C-53]|uniref:Aminoglycoside 6-adenylyltransferase n=1 Tax=Acetatifactor muris TaxID=879566 RepID=A0A2K4ZQH9_9FIRM|nr:MULTISPECIES: aminoglycoside 6-adenylyltransferase [Lachnospiraceae]MCI8775749.1 aminoglycoside 6-adenylyltransferase [Lachnospiraceae bacterium]RKJ08988.1 aminoglycoside 6-adenylyltransferase [bacterium C-53]MCR2050748.1 aminoglycoside 6-adenylyltransferase [Acetatifactor muris]NBH83534.1 aminoglycoside 6-adenylyltransferase [Lachnospiraceae bacterium]NBI03843.1 aminoglycoside 6-adenylyltransferase [Lachnospiraceae bacterium]